MVAQGRLEGDARKQVTAHLARCSDCSREVQLVGALGEFAVAHGTDLLSRRARRTRAAAAPASRRDPVAGGPRPGFGGPLAWVAGALFLLLLIAAVWAFTLLAEISRLNGELEQATGGRGEAVQLQQELDRARSELANLQQEKEAGDAAVAELEQRVVRLGSPVLDPRVVRLDLRRVEPNGESFPRQPVALPAGARWFTLTVTLPQLADAPAHSLEVQNPRGEEVWKSGEVSLDGRSFSISFPTELLSRGIYHLRLLATGGETGAELVAHIPLEITSP
jgi:hypothetical protein